MADFVEAASSATSPAEREVQLTYHLKTSLYFHIVRTYLFKLIHCHGLHRMGGSSCLPGLILQTSVGQRSFAFCESTVWNSLPSALRDNSLSVNSLKWKFTSSSAMAERPRELGDFKKARVNGGTNNHSLKDSHKCLRCR